jgi:mannose/cellobiose epimerase-like protein (N-acyl-D-glucosamine 2-epimerase family)
MLAALSDGLHHSPNAAYERALAQLIGFIWHYRVDPVDGIWYKTVKDNGRPQSRAKAHKK